MSCYIDILQLSTKFLIYFYEKAYPHFEGQMEPVRGQWDGQAFCLSVEWECPGLVMLLMYTVVSHGDQPGISWTLNKGDKEKDSLMKAV